MFCNQCGQKMDDNAVFCTNCGARLNKPAANNASQQTGQQQASYHAPNQNQQNGYDPAGAAGTNPYNGSGLAQKKSLSFGAGIKKFFENYVDFNGRASRSEYWWGFLFTFLLSLTIIGGVVCYIGMLSLTIRRLHDIGKKWTWIFMGLIPYAGFIILIVYYCRDSEGDNAWGPAKTYS